MFKNINKKIFPSAVLACCITLVWACAAMANETRIRNSTAYKASGEVKYERCTNSKFNYNVGKGERINRGRQSACKVSKINAILNGDGKTRTCTTVFDAGKHENFKIQGDMNHCEVVKE